MKNLIFVLLITYTLSGFSQSFVFCPDIKTDEKQGLNNVNLTIVFRDSRVYEQKLKEKCTKSEIFSEFVNCIKATYPTAILKVLDGNKFDENPTIQTLTIKIDFQKYDATFYTGMYVASTKYEVTIFDLRNGENIIREIIEGDGKQFNVLGTKSGKKASNKSFKVAFDKFTSMLDNLNFESNNQNTDNLIQSPQNNIIKTKTERLRELKQLFDEKILTQEEFDLEKKKILDERK